MAKNWIDEVMIETEHVETPRSWIWWSLCCAISASMGNAYHLPMLKGVVIVKGNLYTILLGESGLGKEFPIVIARELVERAEITRVIAGRSSVQAIVKELATFRTRPNLAPINDSRGFIVNGELSTAIIQDPDALTILTDLYDNKSSWTNLLKGDGAEKLKAPYIVTLFGSSPAHFYDSIPQVNIEGGFIGRNFIVYEEKRYKDTDLLDEDESTAATKLEGFPYDKYYPHLNVVFNKGGRVVPDTDAKELFNNWRRKWREKQESDKTGFLNRVPVHVLKVAMCLAAAEKNLTLVIHQGHIETAIERVTSLTYSNKKSTDGKGPDPYAVQMKMVIDFLLMAPENKLRRKQLLVKGYGSYDSAVFDHIIDHLKAIGWVDWERTMVGGTDMWDNVVFLRGEPLEQYRAFIEKQNKLKERLVT